MNDEETKNDLPVLGKQTVRQLSDAEREAYEAEKLEKVVLDDCARR